MIILPKGAVIVKQRVEKYQNTEGIILKDVKSLDKVFNDGKILFTAKELNHLQGKKVVFRENFSEPININGNEFLYFRDLESSMYYIIEE